jgi:hypothetical protein
MDLFTSERINETAAALMFTTMFHTDSTIFVDIEHIPIKLDCDSMITTKFYGYGDVEVISWDGEDLEEVRRYRSRRLNVEYLSNFVEYIDRYYWEWLRKKCRRLDLYSFEPDKSTHIRGVLRKRENLRRLVREKHDVFYINVADPMSMERTIERSGDRDLEILLNAMPNESYVVRDFTGVYGIEQFERMVVFRR